MAGRAVLEYSDLESFPDDGLRRELIGGELLVTPSPVPKHQRAVVRLLRILDDYAIRTGGQTYPAPLDVVLGNHDVVEPDLIFVAHDRIAVIGEKAIVGAPSLVVEILSPSTSRVDRAAKRDLYARYAIAEYWIVALDERCIERCARPENGVYTDCVRFEDLMPSATLLDLIVPVPHLTA